MFISIFDLRLMESGRGESCLFVFICICFKTRFNLLTKACVLN